MRLFSRCHRLDCYRAVIPILYRRLYNMQGKNRCRHRKCGSRGKLCHPSEELFDLSLYLYTYYKSLEDKSCSTRLMRAFETILEFSSYSIPAHNSVLRRFANYFGKAFSKKASQQLRIDNESKCIKKLRMSNRL